MNRAKALQELRSLLEGELRWGRTTSNRATRQAYTQAISDMETLELLGMVIEYHARGGVGFHTSHGDYVELGDIIEWLTDPAALAAEAKRLGVENGNS